MTPGGPGGTWGRMTMTESSSPSHQLLDHRGEIHLLLRAPSRAGIMAEAGRALSEIILPEGPRGTVGGEREVEVTAPDPEALLVEWLNELIYLAESERWVPAEFSILDIGDTRLRARIGGVSVEESPAKVKAATHHGLRLEASGDGLEAEVILDV